MEKSWETDHVGTRSSNSSGLPELNGLSLSEQMPHLARLFEKIGSANENALPPLILADTGRISNHRPLQDGSARSPQLSDLELRMDLAAGKSPAEKLAGARDSFTTEAQRHGLDASRLGTFMKDFEQRCKDADQRGLKSPSSEQIAKTYETLGEMLKGPAQSWRSQRPGPR